MEHEHIEVVKLLMQALSEITKKVGILRDHYTTSITEMLQGKGKNGEDVIQAYLVSMYDLSVLPQVCTLSY
jgi:hypothetical protein